MPVTFDGANRLIIASSGTVTLDVKDDIYSRWKDWVMTGTNSTFSQAFRSVGGDALTPSLSAGAYFFLQNSGSAGWRIRPQEASHELLVIGNLYGEDPDTAIFVPTTGSYTVTIKLERSSLTQRISSEEQAAEVWSNSQALTVGKFVALR